MNNRDQEIIDAAYEVADLWRKLYGTDEGALVRDELPPEFGEALDRLEELTGPP